MTVTPASIALTDLVATMTQLDKLMDQRPFTDRVDRLISELEARRTSLEQQLMDEVRTKLGVDYGILWMAVTPTTTSKG
jgi:benzoyl-CoA reductase/2-hydroxyglutaryl-CoA dehydratase subunit BcrC/BadD/HgdB